jgi:phage terminase large subunit
MRIELPHRFTLREYQRPVWRAIVQDGVKRALCCWHRRAGKDKTFLNILIAQAMATMGNYAYYFPTATLGRKALWDNIDARSGMRVIDHIPKELLVKPNEQQMKLTLVNGSTVQVLGTDNLDVVGGNHVGVIFSESAQHHPSAWDYVRPILAENGGWALFNGTPRGKNWFYRLYEQARQNPEWFCQRLTVEDTGAISAADIESERRAGMREEMIRQEFFCDFTAAMPGAVYGRHVEDARMHGRVGKMPVDGQSQVHTAWDLGSPRNTVVWYFQTVGRMIRVLGCDRDYDETIVERVGRMRKGEYWRQFGNHYLPHDAAQTERSGKTLAMELISAGLSNVKIVPRTVDIWYGINHAKQLFQSMEFREPECNAGLEALEAYHTKEEIEGALVRDEPVHDWSSHASDAFRMIAEAHAAGMFKFTHGDLSSLPEYAPIRERRANRVKRIRVGFV